MAWRNFLSNKGPLLAIVGVVSFLGVVFLFSNAVNAQEAAEVAGEPAPDAQAAVVADDVGQPEAPPVSDVADAADGAQDVPPQGEPATGIVLPDEIFLDQTVAV